MKKWFYGLVARTFAKACESLGIRKQSFSCRHKSHITKVMGHGTVGYCFDSDPELGALVIWSVSIGASRSKWCRGKLMNRPSTQRLASESKKVIPWSTVGVSVNQSGVVGLAQAQCRWRQMREMRQIGEWKRCHRRGKIPSILQRSFPPSVMFFYLKLSYWFKIHQIRYFSYFSYFSILFLYNI